MSLSQAKTERFAAREFRKRPLGSSANGIFLGEHESLAFGADRQMVASEFGRLGLETLDAMIEKKVVAINSSGELVSMIQGKFW